MKNKKILIIILILVIVIVVGVLYMTSKEKEYVIPEGYRVTLQYNMSHFDGPDITYYIYENKVIAESKFIFPVGAPYSGTYTIIEYNNVSTENITTTEALREILKNVEGKEVYRKNT